MQPSTEQQAARHPRAAYWIASLAIAGALLYFSLRGIEWRRVWDTLLKANPIDVALTMALISGALLLRAMRWRVLLSARARVPVRFAFRALAAGSLANNVLPARAGEVVRTVMISKQSGMSKAFVLATALSERVADAITLILIAAAALLAAPALPGWVAGAARLSAAAAFCGVGMIALAPPLERFWLRLLARLPLPGGLRRLAEHVLREGLQGLRSFHDYGRLAKFLAFTAVIWSIDGVMAVVCARSLGIRIGLPPAFLLIAGLGLGSALPSTPGYVGIYQFVAVSVLVPFGLTRSEAIADVLLLQGINLAVLLFWWLWGLALRRA